MTNTTKIVFDAKLVNEDEYFLRRSAKVEFNDKLYEVEYTLIIKLPNGPSITPVITAVEIDCIPEADEISNPRMTDAEWREEQREKIYDGVEIALCNHYGVTPTFKPI